ncbi:hypothetical protein BDB00DRAFT_842871 [Zychaea mexicana]|uniref:uncharacterized protein n=1 Tax=Zychaea mexicana TaxID=64656 RepID=UPI0022FF2F49|nr:uncharacterized protein BDB00DRAFT_842871 [Zychaea mexicana]KAI9489535.1 hypothetical protein BDB00DRAFT_842871 [Zychaea mexicana]
METNERLTCIACKRELRREEISEQVGCDTSITADLVTWTWTPSALFTDWRPKRCPRCERHFTLFAQEWPNRKEKKKKKLVAATPLSSSSSPNTTTEAGDSSSSIKSSKKSSSVSGNKKQSSSKKKSRAAATKRGQEQEKKKQKKKRVKAKAAEALPPLKIETTDDVFDNDDLFSPLLTPLSEFSGDEDDLFNVAL